MANVNISVQYITADGKLTAAGFALFRSLGGTNLAYDAVTRVVSSDTGTDATLPLATSTEAGLAPLSGGGTANFLRADGTWATPGGSGSGDMVLAGVQTNSGLKTFLDGTFGLRNVANTFIAQFSNAITAARTYTLKDASGTVAFTSDITGVNSGTNTGDQTITLTGDVTGTGVGSFAATLATVNATVGSFGVAASVSQFTVNAKGLITTAANVAISIASAAISDSTAAGRAMLTAATATAQTALLDLFSSTDKGLTPLSGGGTTNFLRADGTWAVPASGGSPGGATTQIQYNSAGAFAGDADMTWDAAGNTLGLGGVDTGIEIAAITAEPASPATGKARLYFKSIAGRMSLKSKGPSGLDSNYQTAVWGNSQYRWTMSSVLAGSWQNAAGSGSGTFSTGSPTTTSVFTSMRRSLYANVVTTLNQSLGQRITENLFFRGAVSRQGGFFFAARMGFDVWTNGGRFFGGMMPASTVITADPSALNNTVGFCVDAADSGAISFLTRGTVATKAATGFTITSGKGYDIFIYCAANSTQYTWRIVDINAGTEASGVATLTLPTNTALAGAGVLASNAALTTVSAVQVAINGIYVETDY